MTRASSARTTSSSRPMPKQMEAAATRFDFILNTIPVGHEIGPYLQLLGRSGRMVIVGALSPMPGFHRRATSSGGTGRSADRRSAAFPRLRKCSISAPRKASIRTSSSSRCDQINEAYERLIRNDVRYRFVIDMSKGL